MERRAHCCLRPDINAPACPPAFYLQPYLAFSLPTVAAGVSVPLIGLSTAGYVYGAVIFLLAVVSMIASLRVDR